MQYFCPIKCFVVVCGTFYNKCVGDGYWRLELLIFSYLIYWIHPHQVLKDCTIGLRYDVLQCVPRFCHSLQDLLA